MNLGTNPKTSHNWSSIGIEDKAMKNFATYTKTGAILLGLIGGFGLLINFSSFERNKGSTNTWGLELIDILTPSLLGLILAFSMLIPKKPMLLITSVLIGLLGIFGLYNIGLIESSSYSDYYLASSVFAILFISSGLIGVISAVAGYNKSAIE